MSGLRTILSVFRSRGHEVYDAPYKLNIVGLRSETTIPNQFDDSIHVFFKAEGKWFYRVWPATAPRRISWTKLTPMVAAPIGVLRDGSTTGTLT